MKNIRNISTAQKNSTTKLHTVLISLFLQLSLFFLYSFPCFAEGEDYAKSGATWLLDQLFWVAIVVVIIILIKNIVARNIVSSIVTLVVGGVVCFFIKSPESIKAIGDVVAGVLGL